ncbi:hypothetical protein KY349_00705 [Candidatus Woesearchaeota archaeon]|jgi:hypothetical protein|nr:hypothetical protein [Candidatus Woesearchaeota archaeon]
MGVVRIDDNLDKEIEAILKRPENKYKYPSKTILLNMIIHEHLQKQKKKGK